MTTKWDKIQELIGANEALRSKVFDAREPEDEELRRAQGLLSEVRDLLSDAAKKASPPARLRKFTSNDWSAFAGCQSEEPEIAELTQGHFDAVLILDGETLQVIESGGAESTYTENYSSPRCARLVAEAICASEEPILLAAELIEEDD